MPWAYVLANLLCVLRTKRVEPKPHTSASQACETITRHVHWSSLPGASYQRRSMSQESKGKKLEESYTRNSSSVFRPVKASPVNTYHVFTISPHLPTIFMILSRSCIIAYVFPGCRVTSAGRNTFNRGSPPLMTKIGFQMAQLRTAQF